MDILVEVSKIGTGKIFDLQFCGTCQLCETIRSLDILEPESKFKCTAQGHPTSEIDMVEAYCRAEVGVFKCADYTAPIPEDNPVPLDIEPEFETMM